MKNGKQTLESISQAIWYNQWTLRKFKQYLQGKILEVGCGIGNFTKTLTNYGQVFAIDIDDNHISQTIKKLAGIGQVGFGDIERGEYFFKDQQFDTIVCLNVLEHVKDDKLALNNLYKLLKNEGFLILLVPAHPFLFGEIDKSIDHYRRYIKLELTKSLAGLGFKVIRSRSLNFLGALGWFLAGKILKEDIVNENNIKIFNLIAPFILPLEDLFEPPIGTSILIVAEK